MNTIVIGVIAYFSIGWILATLDMIVYKKKSSVKYDNVLYGIILTVWPLMMMCVIVSVAFDVLVWLSSTIANMIVHEEGGAK